MKDVIECYVYDVIRRVPEKDREELSKELKASIYDMLSDDPTNEEIEKILYELGKPSHLSEKYQQNPRYLISPCIYEEYIMTLRWLMTAGIALIVGISVIFDIIADNIIPSLLDIAIEVIKTGISTAGQIFIWTTLAFIIADRTMNKEKRDGTNQGWNIDDLPELPDESKNSIPLFGNIIELLILAGIFIIAIKAVINNGDNLFGGISMLNITTWQAIIAICFIGICDIVIKIIKGKWTRLVCYTSILSGVVGLAISIYIFMRPSIFTEEFIIAHREARIFLAITAIVVIYTYIDDIWKAIKKLIYGKF